MALFQFLSLRMMMCVMRKLESSALLNTICKFESPTTVNLYEWDEPDTCSA